MYLYFEGSAKSSSCYKVTKNLEEKCTKGFKPIKKIITRFQELYMKKNNKNRVLKTKKMIFIN